MLTVAPSVSKLPRAAPNVKGPTTTCARVCWEDGKKQGGSMAVTSVRLGTRAGSDTCRTLVSVGMGVSWYMAEFSTGLCAVHGGGSELASQSRMHSPEALVLLWPPAGAARLMPTPLS